MISIIHSSEISKWRENLNEFSATDCCHTPEYHNAYTFENPKNKAILWSYKKNGEMLSYPFMLQPIFIDNRATDFYDISSVYGFSGPLSTTNEAKFLDEAWVEFDLWAKDNKVICEFIRFSTFCKNHLLAHKECEVELNREVSISILPDSPDTYLSELKSKTRNMIRRSRKEGYTTKELTLKDGLDDFIKLYEETMSKNNATNFFSYDINYYNNLLKLPENEVSLHGVFDKNDQMVSCAIGLIQGEYGFYHLGASNQSASKYGAGNLVLFDLARGFMAKGVKFFNVGGGRTTTPDDALFKFKRNNGTSTDSFFIGKRVIDSESYNSIVTKWKKVYKNNDIKQLQFYR